MSRLHFDTLTKKQKDTWPSLKPFSRYGALGGGTALAIQLAHRRSYDFDILCPEPISKRFILRIKEHFEKVQILVDTPDELTFTTVLGVKVSFVFYPFAPLYRVITTANLGVYSWKDIALDKAYTIGRRGEWRDYIDLYFSMKSGFSLARIIRGARKKFGGLYSEKLFLSQLCYFGDIKDYSIELTKQEVIPRQLLNYFEGEMKSLKLPR